MQKKLLKGVLTMKIQNKSKSRALFPAVLVMMSLFPIQTMFAHCDTLDGPVVTEARAALEKGDVTPLLKWVNQSDEDEIRAVFESTLKVRKQGPEVKKLADTYFLETLIRIHRAAEGAPYTGLKPAGTIEPAIAAADEAIKNGSVDELAEKIGTAAEKAVKGRFAKLKHAEENKEDSVEAGRKYVEAYVEYIHFVEGLHNMITGKAAGHEHSSETKTNSHEPQSETH